MNSNLDRIIELVKRTGEAGFLMQGDDEPLAILPLYKYEGLLATEEKNESYKLEYPDKEFFANLDQTATDQTHETLVEDDFITPHPEADKGRGGVKLDFTSGISQNLDIETPTPDSDTDLGDVPHEEEEEKFYLEPVE